MKKVFKEPQIELVLIDSEDIIKTSGEVQWWPEGDPGQGA